MLVQSPFSKAAPAPARAQRDVFLMPGEYFVGSQENRVRTILGSCVAVTLWHPRLRLGAMSHSVLHARGAQDTQGIRGLCANYCSEALELMFAALARKGGSPHECVAKIFGGGSMFPNWTSRQAGGIGQRNGETARQHLKARGVRIAAESLYGEGHQSIVFDVSNGDVWVRRGAA
jgi:chemotaxis protein CheD